DVDTDDGLRGSWAAKRFKEAQGEIAAPGSVDDQVDREGLATALAVLQADGGRALKNASTSDRCSFRRNTALPAASNAVRLEDPLGDAQTDCGNLHGGQLLQLVALNGPSLAHRCRQGSSTASGFKESRFSRSLPGTHSRHARGKICNQHISD